MLCVHPMMRHTVWYWLEDPNDPYLVPYELHFDNRKDALEWASHQVASPPVELRWIKIFRAHNEVYECYRWENPTPIPEPEIMPGLHIVDKPKRWWQRILLHENDRGSWWQLRK